MNDEEQELISEVAAEPDIASTWYPPPSWLRVPPTVCGVPPPVQTRHQVLPVDRLTWEDFERLCLRLLELEAEPVHVSAPVVTAEMTTPFVARYGLRGQAQYGIDVYARDRLVLGESPPRRRYVSLQARRTKVVTKTGLVSSVDDFLEGRWAHASRKFVFATSTSTVSTDLADEIEGLASRLAQESIDFVVWDQEAISMQLKNHPEIIDDFFGRHWVVEFCGVSAAGTLGARLDALKVADLRRELARIYAASFGVADSGLIAFRFSETRPVGLLDRFVTPDLVSTTPQTVALQQPADDLDDPGVGLDLQAIAEEAAAWNVPRSEEDPSLLRGSARKLLRVENPQVMERRSADQWIGTEAMQVIVGDPGSGKSTLLRYLVLDLLSEEPRWRTVAERWGRRLPVWMPFHFFTQRVSGQTGAPASVGETIKAWLDQHDASHVWPLVQLALNDQRLLLVVDGLDEWVSDEAGRYAVAALETFSTSRSTPLVVSARPYGLARLTLGAGWSYKRIAPLTPEQQRLLARHYFDAIFATEDQSLASDVIERSVDDFLSQVRNVPNLRAISGTPLFLVLLVALNLSSVSRLPTERFEIYSQAVQLLVADHPAKRRVAAAVTAPRHRLSDGQLRIVLANVAFVSQIRGDISTLQETKLREDVLQALTDPNYLAMNSSQAADTADQVLDVAEGELGLLVRQGPEELSFLHRVLQEQLAAEYISDRLNPAEMNDLFAEHVSDPRWREVLLATIWRLSRPSELRDLMEVIRTRIDESTAGLRTREIFAEIIFGPYGLPAPDIQQNASDIIKVIETHPYGTHRARLLDSVLTGLEGAATEDIVGECLARWTLLVQMPSGALVWEIARVPPVASLSKNVCKLLLMALRNPHSWIAYEGAVAIARRCSNGEIGSDEERHLLRAELLNILAHPPSGLAQAAALTALALGWRSDPLVVDILNEARRHTDSGVRIVALSDALGVLRSTFYDDPVEPPRDIQQLDDVEREWLIGNLKTRAVIDVHSGLLVAALSEAARGQQSVLEGLIKDVESGATGILGPIWPVTLNVLANDDRIVDIVCNQLRSEKYSTLSRGVMDHERLLELAYPPGSTHNGRVASAVEDRLRMFKDTVLDRELFGLAAVDHGPVMKETLLEALETSSWPHWPAEALISHFSDDAEVRTALHSVMMGDPTRASMICNVATRVLATDEVLPRLLTILRELEASTNSRRGRYDIVASAIVQACQDQAISTGPEFESVAEETMKLMPTVPDPFLGDPRYILAVGFYPSAASKITLAELADLEDRPLEPFIRVFRNDPDQVQQFLESASMILCSLPAYLRARVCQSLVDRAADPDMTLHLTRRWADEVSESNKSVASLAYHRALLRENEEGRIEKGQWEQALMHLGEQASCYGPDHEARRRSAWVGMCVCGDWSTLEGRLETIGEPAPVGVLLADPLNGPDSVLLRQLASRWQELRSEFGDTLLTRLSGKREMSASGRIWDALALVAAQDVTLEHEIESAVADDTELLKQNGVLAWYVTRRNTSADEIADALITHLKDSDEHRDNLVSVLVSKSERIGLLQERLRGRLEDALRRVPAGFRDPAMEILAMLFPEHPAVRDAWQELSKLIAGGRSGSDYSIHPQTYFAIAYAAVESSEVLKQIERNLDRLDEIDHGYFDSAFTLHVSHRLRRDDPAVSMVRDAVMNPATPDSRAAVLASLLADAVGLDESLLSEIERRIAVQDDVRLAPVVSDRAASATLSVRAIYSRLADAAWERDQSAVIFPRRLT